jgi:DNA polymerase V
MEKTIRELNGISCMELEEVTPNKHEIVSSRSFGNRVRDLQSLEEAVTAYTSKAAEKLRKQQSVAGGIRVFIHTSPFGDGPKYANSMLVPLPIPTDDTVKLVRAARWALGRIFRIGYNYQKAGVMLTELTPANQQQVDLFSNMDKVKSSNLMSAFDAINAKMGKSTIRLASQGFNNYWQMKQGNKSKGFTTNWAELVVAV